MRISPVTSFVSKRQNVNFRSKDETPIIEVNNEDPDKRIVALGYWGPDYVYPITAGQLREDLAKEQSRYEEPKKSSISQESYEDLYKSNRMGCILKINFKSHYF